MLLLDELFGALDAKVRQELRQRLAIPRGDQSTTIFVTHDQEEAFELADYVVVMRGGRVEQEGSPQEVFDRPANPFVMDFLGNVNVFHGRVQDGKVLLPGFEMAYPDCPEGDYARRRPTCGPTNSKSIAGPTATRACWPRCCRSIPTARSPKSAWNRRTRISN